MNVEKLIKEMEGKREREKRNLNGDEKGYKTPII